MIQSETEYQTSLRRLKEQETLLAADFQKLEEQGLSPEEIERVLAPLRSFHDSIQEEVDDYERRTGVDVFRSK